jgi:hypothetical protein
MKFRTFLFSRLDVFSQSYLRIDDGHITIVTKRYREKIHANDIRFVDIDTPKIGFSTMDLVVGVTEKKISIHGFTKRQCEEINTAINSCQISNYKFNPLKQYANLKVLQSLTLILRSISSPRKFEIPLIQIIATKMGEGLNIVRKLQCEEWQIQIQEDVIQSEK